MRRLTPLLSLAALLLCSTPAHAEGPWHVSKPLAPGADDTTPSQTGHHTVIPYVRYKLKNGLTVILYEDHTLPQVRVSVWYHVGACYEPKGLTGTAHLFEHLMFEGSRDLQKGIAAGADSQMFNPGVMPVLTVAGASDLNGMTGFEKTMYFETMPSENLELTLWLESDRMGFLVINHERIHKQRDIVKNEARQRVKTTPYAKAQEDMWPHLFPDGGPCAHDPIGTFKDLDHATVENMKAFYRKAYAPANATLVIGGDLPKNTKKLVDKYFASLPARPALPPVEMPAAAIHHEVVLHHKEKIGRTTRVFLAWDSPALFKAGDAESDLAATMLTGSPDALLTKALLDTGLVTGVNAGVQHQGFGSVFQISAELTPGVQPKTVIAEIDQVIAGLAKHIDEGDLARARMRVETEAMGMLQGLSNKVQLLQYYQRYANDPDHFYDDLIRYTKVTPASLEAYVARTLGPNQRVRMVAVPTKPLPPVSIPKLTPPAEKPAPAKTASATPPPAATAKKEAN